MQTAISSKAGARVRLYITDCDDNPIVPADCSQCRYTVYQVENYSRLQPVEGHSNVPVPVSSILETVETDVETGKTYNFEHYISMISGYPFPERNEDYVVEYEFFDTSGEAALVVQLEYRSK